ncbi:MAG: beta-galactosidase [Thermodesulfobacteriota bacterium]
MKILTAITVLLLLFVSSSISFAANYPFGLHNVARDLNSVKGLGVHQVRIAAITWDSIEPQKGTYNFTTTDQAILKHQEGNVRSIVATMRDINMWGGNLVAQTGYDPKDPLTANSGFPSDIEAWKAFINAVVERYDGDGVNDMPGLVFPVKYWQIEGEWQWQWKDTTENYLNFLDISYQEIKKADPTATVIAGAVTGATAFAVGEGFDPGGYFERDDGTGGSILVSQSQLVNSPIYQKNLRKANNLLKYGQNSFDILDIHLYSSTASTITPAMNWLKSTMATYGYVKPVWSLENAGPLYNYREDIHAREVVKRYLFSATSGIEKTFWSSLHVTEGWPDKFLFLSLIDEFNRKKQAFYTYKLLVSKIDGYDTIEILNIGAGVNCFKVMRQNAATYIMWSDQGATGTLTLPNSILRVTNSATFRSKTFRYGGGDLSLKLWDDPLILEVQ